MKNIRLVDLEMTGESEKDGEKILKNGNGGIWKTEDWKRLEE